MLRFLADSFRQLLKNMARDFPAEPLIVILGATGTGKSKLAVDLARRHNGEIINADAMQIYRGLPIVTNKIPEIERHGVKHHLLDIIELHDKPWTVHNFVRETSKTVEDIRARGKVPIVVGGTSYYVYSLLFQETLVTETDSKSRSEAEESEVGNGENGRKHDLSLLEGTNEQLYRRLVDIDPSTAQTWHPNERRKVQRALEIWHNTGKKSSDVYAEQEARKKNSSVSGTSLVRYNPLLFWLTAEKDVLRQRLNARVDTMLQQGLLQEVNMMRQLECDAKHKGVALDQTKGIWVSIGYKELRSWLDLSEERTHRTDNRNDEEVSKALAEGVDAIKAATRRYANVQEHWLRGRLAKTLKTTNMIDKLFVLDCTDVSAWDEKILSPSSDIVACFLRGAGLPQNSSLSELAGQTFAKMGDTASERKAHICESCKITLMSNEEWLTHLKSRKHQKVMDGIRKRAKRDQYLAKHQLQCEQHRLLEPP